jgi:hypothetical protein
MALLGYQFCRRFFGNQNWIRLGSAITATNSAITSFDRAPPEMRRFYRIALLPTDLFLILRRYPVKGVLEFAFPVVNSPKPARRVKTP